MNATLLDLADRCEKATGADRNLDQMIHARDGLEGVGAWSMAPAYTASLDAAMTLVPEHCQYTIEQDAAWVRQLDDDEPSGVRTSQGFLTGRGGTCTALALCAAALRARAAQ